MNVGAFMDKVKYVPCRFDHVYVCFRQHIANSDQCSCGNMFKNEGCLDFVCNTHNELYVAKLELCKIIL